MNRDLEEQLNEMGPEYRAVVARLRAAREAQGIGDRGAGNRKQETGIRGWLVAASLLVAAGFGILFQAFQTSRTSQTFFRGPHEYQMGIPEMIATQNPDGSWKNDFLTRRNAAALRGSSNPDAQVAYKKAMRNLRSRGVL